jgi:hypothetical protein
MRVVSVGEKLQIKPGQSVAVLHEPSEVDIDLPEDASAADPEAATPSCCSPPTRRSSTND